MYAAVLKGRRAVEVFAMLAIAACVFSLASPAFAKKKPTAAPAAEAAKDQESVYKKLNFSKIVWPPPPAIPRIRFLNYFSNEKWQPIEVKAKKKAGWMDRMAGGLTQEEKTQMKTVFALWTPYGMAVDKSGKLYVADSRVGAVFIFNTETKDVELIKNSASCRFGFIVGLTMDDDETLYVSDTQLKRVNIFDAQHKYVSSFNEGMREPGGLALDVENRFLYVVDTAQDQVLVYDADSHKLLRRIGKGGQEGRLTSVGDFAKPTNAAVDKDGNLYVTDTWNDRVEIFDADGNFIRTFGKNGDGPGRFTRPKGIAVDVDGHIWVADAVQDRLQIFTNEGQLLMVIGQHGTFPGQFQALAGLTIDHKNRVFTSEQFQARVQMFQYITDAEAKAETERRKAQDEKGGPKDKAAGAPSPAPAQPAPAAAKSEATPAK